MKIGMAPEVIFFLWAQKPDGSPMKIHTPSKAGGSTTTNEKSCHYNRNFYGNNEKYWFRFLVLSSLVFGVSGVFAIRTHLCYCSSGGRLEIWIRRICWTLLLHTHLSYYIYSRRIWVLRIDIDLDWALELQSKLGWHVYNQKLYRAEHNRFNSSE